MNIVKRCKKEYEYYQSEVLQLNRKLLNIIEKAGSQEKLDPYVLKKHNEVVEENNAMIGPARERWLEAKDGLREYLIANDGKIDGDRDDAWALVNTKNDDAIDIQ